MREMQELAANPKMCSASVACSSLVASADQTGEPNSSHAEAQLLEVGTLGQANPGSLFLKTFLFLEQSEVHRKIEREVQRFPICPLLPHMHWHPP